MAKIIQFKYYVLTLLFALFAGALQAQNVDSLMQVFKNKSGEVNIDSLIVKGRALLYSNPDKSYELSRKAIELSKHQRNKMKEGDSYRLLGSYYSDIEGDYDSAFFALNIAEDIYKKIDSKEALEGTGALYHNYGSVYHRKGDYVEAIHHYTKALSVFDRIGDNTIRPKTLNNLSSLYSFLKDYPKAEKYAAECFKISKKNHDEHLISIAGVTLASALIYQKKYSHVKEYIELSKSIATKRNDLYILELAHLNHGIYYTVQEEYSQAVSEYEKAREYAVALGNEWEQMRVLANLSSALIRNNQFNESKPITDEAFRLSEKLGSLDIKQGLFINYSLIEAHNKDYKKAYDYLNLSYLLKDTVLNEDTQRQITLLETIYETEKKELKINSLQKERFLNRIIGLALVVSLLALLLSLYFRHKNTKTKKELAEQKILQLEQEKQLVATQAILEGETAERSRLARDLHDGLGGMLSAVKLNLFDMKKGGVSLDAEDVSRLNKVMRMLDSSMQELRRVAHNMMPESLSRYGLKVSLGDFCNNFNNVHFHYFGEEERLENKLEIMIYRTVHELINNALKHARAENINVQIIQEPDRISLTVQDDGKGFDPQAETRGSGLNNIRNRVTSVNGTMNIFSEPGSGTEINVEFKL